MISLVVARELTEAGFGGVHNLTVYWHGQEFRKQNGTQEHLGVLFVKEVSDPKILTCGVCPGVW